MKFYLKALAGFYSAGALLHIADLLDLRLHFSEMDFLWRSWIVFLTVFDTAAAIGLWKERRWGEALFLLIATAQLVAYLGFSSRFGSQPLLVGFHFLTVIGYFLVRSVSSTVPFRSR